MTSAAVVKLQVVAAPQVGVSNTTEWLREADDSIVDKDRDLRIPNITPEQLAQVLMSGGAKPRPENKKRKAP